MSSNAQRFAETVLAAFKAAGHYTDKEVGDAGGPSTTTLTRLRKVAEEGEPMPPPRGDTLRNIDRAADWPPGSARALWHEGRAPVAMRRPNLFQIVGEQEPTTEQVRRQRRSSKPSGLDGWVESLANRILEVEERLDYLESRLGAADGLAAHDEEHDIEDEQGHDEHP